MRKVALSMLAAALGLSPGLAAADVFVFAFIDKHKDITVEETIDITKDVDLLVEVDLTAEKAAESQALVNQTNAGNRACTNCDEKQDLLLNSGNQNAGVISVNQAAGNMNNQGNAVAIAVDVRVETPPPPPPPQQGSLGFAEAQAAVDQRNGVVIFRGFDGTELESAGNVVHTINLLFRNAQIIGSLNQNSGVVHANQATGNMANQANALSVALALEPGVALSEADLGQINVFNTVRESDASGQRGVGINKAALVANSINGNTGIVGVNQSVGNMANQANVVAVAAALGSVGPSGQ